jgi:GNAT superfamily N-acetyltransferase
MLGNINMSDLDPKIYIREYKRDDSVETGILIADMYWKYNLGHIADEEKEKYLGGFFYCRSSDEKDMERIEELIKAPYVYIAVVSGRIAGVLRGSLGRLHSLFVHEDFHRNGIGGRLVRKFEEVNISNRVMKITLAASLYAVPFYEAVGYKRSTGIRRSNSFGGADFHIQPMKKIL